MVPPEVSVTQHHLIAGPSPELLKDGQRRAGPQNGVRLRFGKLAIIVSTWTMNQPVLDSKIGHPRKLIGIIRHEYRIDR